MNQKTSDETLKNTATAAGEATPAQTPAATDTTDEKPITRSEVVALIAEGVAAALKKQDAPAAGSTEDTTQRSDDGKGDEAGGKLLASVESVAESVKGLAASMEAMTKRMDTMEGATVVRSDNADATATPTKRKDVFAGVFGPRG